MLKHDPNFDYDVIRIDIYSRPDCPACHRVKDELTRHAIRFREIILPEQAQRNALYDQIGLEGNKRTVPQIVVDGLRIGGADAFFTGQGMNWSAAPLAIAGYTLDEMTPTPGLPEPPRVTLDANDRIIRPGQTPEVVDEARVAVPVESPAYSKAESTEVVDAHELVLVA